MTIAIASSLNSRSSALGHAAIKALNQAIIDRDHFVSATTWPNDTLFTDRNDAEVATMRAELDQIVQDRIRDVLDGPGLGVIKRGELFHQPQIVELIEKALADRQHPG